LKVEGVIVGEDSGMEMGSFSSDTTRGRVLKGYMQNSNTLIELYAASNIYCTHIMQEIQGFNRQTGANYRRLPAERNKLEILLVGGFGHLENQLANFKEPASLQIYRARSTVT